MATTPAVIVVSAPKVSFLKHFGQILGRILKFVAKDSAPIVDQAAPVLEVLLPQFATPIGAAKNLMDSIAKQAIVTEAIAQNTGAATSGPDKLAAVIAGIGPELDAWVASRFPGATQVAAAEQAGLVNAIVAIVNKQPSPLASTATPAA